MSKVDNRIVEMGFENKSFEQNIKQSQTSLQDFNKALTNTGDGKAFSGLGGVVGGVTSKFSLLGTVAIGALLKIGSQAVVAGQQLLNSLGPQQIAAGFQEYELKINSIKVMLAGGRTKEGLPVTLDMVNSELEKLNAYSDQTIYSFSDMTRNIGKFTNAGVDLESSVQAIKGIANAAALSGANSEEASRAMYNFAQALSAGYVKLIDWKSIENANMATVEFKTQLLESAVAAGTLEKQADGMYKVLSSGRIISATKDFNDSLQEQWMNTETLTTTLERYADATTDIGKRATEAATKVRTFKQLMDTTKEALGSGWAMSFEHIFGNFDEATKLWTKVNDAIGGIIQKSSDARNSILKDWKAMGGRDQIIYAISLAFQHLGRVIETIKMAFRRVFPSVTADTLMKISIGFTKFITSIQPSPTLLGKLRIIFEGIFRTIDLGARIFGKFFSLVFKGIKFLFSLASGRFDILDLFVNISEFFIQLNKSYKTGTLFPGMAKLISDGLKWITEQGGFFVKIAGAISDGLKWVSDQIKALTITIPTRKETEEKVGKESFISKLIERLKELSDLVKQRLAPVIDFLKKIFAELKEAISINWKIDGIQGIIGIINKLLTGGVILAISNFVKSLSSITGGLTAVFNTPLGVKNSFLGVMTQLQETLKSYQKNLDSKRLLSIAAAIGILTLSLAVLTLLDQKKMLIAVGAITALFANIVTSMLLLNKLGGQGIGGGVKGSAQLLVIATAILILASAMLLMKDIDPSSIWALTVVLAESVGAMLILGKMKAKDIIQGGNAIMQLSMAINFIALAVVLLGKLDPKQLKIGLQGVSILLAEMLLVSVALSAMGGKGGSILAAGAAMGIIALALLQLVGVVAILAQFKPEKLLLGIGGLASILGIVALGMITIANPKVLFGAVAMQIMAIAITMFVPALLALGSLPIKTIATALIAIAALFTVFGIAGAVLAPVVLPILALAGAVMLLGLAVLAAGTGLALFGMGLALIATVGVGAIGILTLALTATIALIPFFLKKVGEGLIALAVVIGESAPQLMIAIGQLITAFLALIVEQIPAITEAAMKLMLGFLDGITNNIGPIVESIFQMLINILDAITEKLPELLTAGADLIIALITGISNEQVRIIDAAFTTIINFINGLADSIRENTPLLLEAVANLATAFIDGLKDYFKIEEGESIVGSLIDGLVKGAKAGVNLVISAVEDLGTAVLDGIKKLLGIASPSKEMKKIGEYIDMGLIQGLKGKAQTVANTAREIGENSITALRSTMDRISDVIDSDINSSPVITPVLNLSNLRNNASTLNQLLSNGQSYNLATAKITDDKLLAIANQNGSNSLPEKTQIINEFNLNGVTIRSDADIDKLATELYRKQENAMRSRGIRPAYST